MRKHFYQNHEYVRLVLTLKYGFTYKGVGDNSEECFIKGTSGIPENIWIHPRFCSYEVPPLPTSMASRQNSVRFQSDSSSEKDQEKAFNKLLVHLDEFTDLPFPSKFEDIEAMYALLEEKRLALQQIVTATNSEKSEMIPSIYKNLSDYQFLLSKTISLLQ